MTKLLHITITNGGAITLHPNSILYAMPNPKNLMSTIIGYGVVNGEVAISYNQFIRKWQAALDGKEIVESANIG